MSLGTITQRVRDHAGRGTHYEDRNQRILGVCNNVGILHHEEWANHRGTYQPQRVLVTDVESVEPVLDTEQYEKYGYRVSPRVLRRFLALDAALAMALNVPAVTIERDGHTVYVRVPKERGDNVLTFTAAWKLAPDLKPGSLLLGANDAGEQFVLDLVAGHNVHAAVIGMTSSGKTTLMQTMVLSAFKAGGTRVALFDPLGNLAPLSGHPSVWRGGLFGDVDACERGLACLVRQLAKPHQGLLYVFVDEVPKLTMNRPVIADYLKELAQSGRHAGIHLVLGSQGSTVSALQALRNVPARLVGHVADRDAAYRSTSRAGTGAERLRGRGDFLYVNGDVLKHFQAATPERELADLVKTYPPREARLPAPTLPRTVASPQAVERSGAEVERSTLEREPKPVDPRVVQKIQSYVTRRGTLPSLNKVREMSLEVLDAGYNRDMQRRALETAGYPAPPVEGG